jgi:cysteine-rich repeat protein
VTAPCEGADDRVRVEADLCGDGQTTGSETCDDGNPTAGDGCDAQCRFEGVGAIDSQSGTCTGGGSINLVVTPIGQLFVPSVPALAAVDLLFGLQRDDLPQQVTLRLRVGDLSGALLAEQTVTTSDRAGGGWYHFRFAAPVAVTPGQIHALEVVTDGDNVSWGRTDGSPECPLALPNGGGIAAGERLNHEDLAFRTYAAL